MHELLTMRLRDHVPCVRDLLDRGLVGGAGTQFDHLDCDRHSPNMRVRRRPVTAGPVRQRRCLLPSVRVSGEFVDPLQQTFDARVEAISGRSAPLKTKRDPYAEDADTCATDRREQLRDERRPELHPTRIGVADRDEAELGRPLRAVRLA